MSGGSVVDAPLRAQGSGPPPCVGWAAWRAVGEIELAPSLHRFCAPVTLVPLWHAAGRVWLPHPEASAADGGQLRGAVGSIPGALRPCYELCVEAAQACAYYLAPAQEEGLHRLFRQMLAQCSPTAEKPIKQAIGQPDATGWPDGLDYDGLLKFLAQCPAALRFRLTDRQIVDFVQSDSTLTSCCPKFARDDVADAPHRCRRCILATPARSLRRAYQLIHKINVRRPFAMLNPLKSIACRMRPLAIDVCRSAGQLGGLRRIRLPQCNGRGPIKAILCPGRRAAILLGRRAGALGSVPGLKALRRLSGTTSQRVMGEQQKQSATSIAIADSSEAFHSLARRLDVIDPPRLCTEVMAVQAAISMARHFDQVVGKGICLVGNGRSVLGRGAGPSVDQFKHVVRFNNFRIAGYEDDVGTRLTLWVVSDYTCVKLLTEHTQRASEVPVLVAIPYFSKGRRYYERRRKQLEEELERKFPKLAPAIRFIPVHDAKDIVDKYRFGVRWPSTGLLAIWHLLRGLEGERPMVQDMPVGDLWEEGASLACGQSLTARNSLFLHGFDFFHKINGRIHYMEDRLHSDHSSILEERICKELAKSGKLHFVV